MNRSRLIHRCFLIAVLLLASLLGGCRADQGGLGSPLRQSISLQPCQLSAPGLPQRLAAQCGKVTVPEDRSSPSGSQIELHLAVIPAVSRNPAPDPLVFLAGGPGQAATEAFLHYSYSFERINQKRDIILIDQRGAGKSNPLVCPGLEDLENDAEANLAPLLRECLQHLNTDPALYTTWAAAADLNQVREALGAEQLNLYGVSYGTRLAQMYLNMFPDRVRAVILDGVVPQEEALGMDVAQDAQRALNLIFNRCSQEPSCGKSFPNIEREFHDVLNFLAENPVTTSLPHPLDGRNIQITFTADEFSIAVRLLSYAPETAALLPLLIHTTAESGDFRLMAAQYVIVTQQFSDSISEGLGYSVLCSEDAPFFDQQAARQKNADTYLGNIQVEQLEKICQVWPAAPAPEGYKQKVRSSVPALILSGEADPVTPPDNGMLVAAGLPNSMHLIAPGMGHGVFFRGCIARLAARFIEDGAVSNLDAACVQEIRPMPFFMDPSGPPP